MNPGPDIIYECPKCKNLIAQGSIASGNTFDARFYSDGKRVAPMLPDFPDLTKCKKCHNILWLSKMKELGALGWGGEIDENWRNADKAEFLEIDDYFKLLTSDLIENKADEQFVRMQIWWAYNDRIRDGHKLIFRVINGVAEKNIDFFADEKDGLRWKQNCIELINLLDPSDMSNKIMMAEIHRNLGDFEKCMGIMDSIVDPDFNWIKDIFKTECNAKNKKVVAL